MRLIVALLFLLALPCLAKKPPKPPPAPPPPADSIVWTKGAPLNLPADTNYTPVIVLGPNSLRVYSNYDGKTAGDLFVRNCTLTSCGSAVKVLHVPSPRDQYIRTSAVARAETGTYYALLYTGDGYPTQGGYSPSWAISPDGIAWTWKGPIPNFGRNQSSAAALVIDEDRRDAYRFMAWLDLDAGLVMMHSATGEPNDWQSDGRNVWPYPGESPQFCTAALDPYGYHLICANTWPATALRHLFSCDGLAWKVVEPAADVIGPVGKGTNLAWDQFANTLRALTSGQLWATSSRELPC